MLRKNMPEIAIFIKTFYREMSLFNCVQAIRQNVNDISYRLYIADDGEVSKEKKELYNKLKSEGHVVLELPFNTGASASRNMLLKMLQNEKYVLRMDDDFEITPETNLSAMKRILDKFNEVGAVADLERQLGNGKGVFSGQISPSQGFIEIKGDTVIKRMISLKKFNYHHFGDIQYAKADFTRNMLLLKREIFNDIKWEDNIKFAGEHLDFLLQIRNSKWDIVFTTNSIHIHNESIKNTNNSDVFKKMKTVENSDLEVLKRKWGITTILVRRTLLAYFRVVFVKCKNLLSY